MKKIFERVSRFDKEKIEKKKRKMWNKEKYEREKVSEREGRVILQRCDVRTEINRGNSPVESVWRKLRFVRNAVEN